MLSLYVEKGVKELDDGRLKNLLELKYDSLTDAKEVLGDVKSIRSLFIGFQKYLYEDEVVNEFGYALMVAEPKNMTI